MKLRIKYIAILVIVSLTAIFAYQTYWLRDMYRTSKAQSRMTIQNAIRNADYLELMIRVDSISEAEEKSGEYSSVVGNRGEIAFSASFDRSKKDRMKNTFKQTYKRKDTIYVDEEKDFDPQNIGLPEGFDLKDGYHALEFLAFQVQGGLHSVMDFKVEPIVLARFDSILNVRLRDEGLNIRHYTRILKLDNDSTLAASLTTDIDTTKLDRFEYVYDAQGEYAFHVFAESTGYIIIRQMTGILATSFFILIVLGSSFWFLIRTILRQKTLDEMKSDFTNNITHELKTPIAVAYAANDALLNFNIAVNEKQRTKYLKISQEQLQKLSGLVEQILSIGMERRKTFQLKPEEIDVASLVTSLVEQHKLKADKPVHFEINMSDEPIIAVTDRTHLSNIISNLIDNAIKYSSQKAWIGINVQLTDGKLTISIADKGIGIATDKQKHIFDKFYRVPTGNLHNARGYGLGLYYVKTMMEKMGGKIDVKSEAGKGSLFKLEIEYNKKHTNEDKRVIGRR